LPVESRRRRRWPDRRPRAGCCRDPRRARPLARIGRGPGDGV